MEQINELRFERRSLGNEMASERADRLANLLTLSYEPMLAWRLDGAIEFWNAGAERLYGFEQNEAVGRNSHALLQTKFPIDFADLRSQLRDMRHWSGELCHICKDGSEVVVESHMQLFGESIVLEANRDVTERRKIEVALRESEARLQAAVDLVKLGCFAWNLKANEWQWDDRLRAMWGLPPGTPVSYEIWRAGVHPDDVARVERTLQDTLEPETSHPHEIEYRVVGLTNRVERWIAARRQIHFENGRPATVFGVVLDVTERKRAEQANLLLIAELQHRTRNLLAVVSAISTETLAASNALGDFSATFGSRLEALSRVQGLLSRGDPAPVTIGELVRLELQALGAEPDGRRVTVEGSEVALPEQSVQILALALHELATNARKHGALAAPEGRLTVTWRTTNSAVHRLVIEWCEHSAVAGRENATSVHKGFGRKLIEEALPYQLDAQTRLEFRPEGVFCSVAISLDSEHSGTGP